MKNSRQISELKGRIAEIIAIIFLSCKLYNIIKYRYKTNFGEIDLIAIKGNNLVFIEVKQRQSIQKAQESVSAYQQKRIIEAANFFIAKHNWAQNLMLRYDIIATAPFKLPKHYKDAFRPL